MFSGGQKLSETSQKEIARIHHSDNQDLVATIVDNVGLDLRVFIKKDSYLGFTKRGLRCIFLRRFGMSLRTL